MQHSILVASRRSGLSQHVIRAWEKRYQVLSPCRCERNQRLYSDEDIERLKVLRDLTQQGHRISRIATACTNTLRDLLSKCAEPNEVDCALEKPADFVKAALLATQSFEAEKLLAILNHARAHLGHRLTLRQVVAPLIACIGEFWREGQISEAQEHLHTAVVREFLGAPLAGASLPANAPELVVTTPAGTSHELGALLVSATARDLGWRVTYLGPSLPAGEITKVVQARKARAVALSLVYPLGCASVAEELKALRRMLPPNVAILIGGRAAASYREKLNDDCSYLWVSDLNTFEEQITGLH